MVIGLLSKRWVFKRKINDDGDKLLLRKVRFVVKMISIRLNS